MLHTSTGVCSEIQTTHKHALHGENAESLNVRPSGTSKNLKKKIDATHG